MDCTGFRKYIGAFADGELEVEQNLEALEHLNMCPVCAARVAGITSLKAALVRTYGNVQAPRELRDRVLATLEFEAVGPRLAGRQRGSGLRLRLRHTVPLGMAAALIVSVLLWQYWPRNEPPTATITVVTDPIVADIREQHRLCVSHRGLRHHSEWLSRDLRVISQRLSNLLQLDVIAPDLTERGFELVGADPCGVLGRPGAHVLYMSRVSGVALSVFTLGRVVALGSGSEGGGGAELEYFVSTDDPLSVVAWNEGPQTYAFCAELPEVGLLELAGVVRTATAVIPGDAGPLLAVACGR